MLESKPQISQGKRPMADGKQERKENESKYCIQGKRRELAGMFL